MNDVPDLRGALAGLIDFAAGEEEALLELVAAAGPEEDGSPQRWAAAPLVAIRITIRLHQLETPSFRRLRRRNPLLQMDIRNIQSIQ